MVGLRGVVEVLALQTTQTPTPRTPAAFAFNKEIGQVAIVSQEDAAVWVSGATVLRPSAAAAV